MVETITLLQLPPFGVAVKFGGSVLYVGHSQITIVNSAYTLALSSHLVSEYIEICQYTILGI